MISVTITLTNVEDHEDQPRVIIACHPEDAKVDEATKSLWRGLHEHGFVPAPPSVHEASIGVGHCLLSSLNDQYAGVEQDIKWQSAEQTLTQQDKEDSR